MKVLKQYKNEPHGFVLAVAFTQHDLDTMRKLAATEVNAAVVMDEEWHQRVTSFYARLPVQK